MPARARRPSEIYSTRPEWQAQLDSLPSLDHTGGKIPSIFLAHGRKSSTSCSGSRPPATKTVRSPPFPLPTASHATRRPTSAEPLLIHSPEAAKARGGFGPLLETQGPEGDLANFLRDLGPALLAKYNPRAVVVFSAHWETPGGAVVTDYGGSNPLLYDYYGFPPELYDVKFTSRGDGALSRQVVDLFGKAGIKSRLSPAMEPRGEDGRGFSGPGLDHGVFVPFKLMFGDNAPVPIVQVSIDSSLTAKDEWSLGAALEPLRSEGVLIISGGLTVHTFRDFSAFAPSTAKPIIVEWEEAINAATAVEDPVKRRKALEALLVHPGKTAAHHR